MDKEQTPLDLGTIEAHLEQADQDFYLTTYHPTTLKYFTALVAEVKELRSRNAIFRKLIEDWEIRPENSGEDDL